MKGDRRTGRRSVRAGRRGVSNVIAVVMLVLITIVAGVFLWSYRLPTPAPPTALYYSVYGTASEPAWGDGSDCANGSPQVCKTLPADYIVFTSHSPEYLRLTSLEFVLMCNGTSYLSATLAGMEWVPGTSGTPGPTAPQLGHCGSYTPPKAAFNRLAYFQQATPGDLSLANGDAVVVYLNAPGSWVTTDDDYHGIPTWCFTIPGACSLSIVYLGGATAGIALAIPVSSLSAQ
jgi:flagellin-like protein